MSRWILGCVMLWGLLAGRPTVSLGQATDVVTVKASAGTARQQQWLAATPQDRVRFAEALGDDGARALAKAKGYEALYDGFDRMLLQGPDQVYRAGDGRVIVYEAKGGSGQLGHAYGHAQGSAEWAVESAKRVLRSTKASQAERLAAREILEAAARGKLDVHVVRTSHVLGEPTAAVLENASSCTDEAAQLARTTLDDMARAGGAAVDDTARAAAGRGLSRASSRGLVVVGIAVDAGYRANDAVELERQFEAGEITSQQREVSHARNAAGMAGGWVGAWAGAKLGAAGGAAAGSAVAPGPGTAIGGAIGGIAGGVAGYFGGEAAAAAAAEWAVDKVHAAGATVYETANSAGGDVQRAWNWAWGN